MRKHDAEMLARRTLGLRHDAVLTMSHIEQLYALEGLPKVAGECLVLGIAKATAVRITPEPKPTKSGKQKQDEYMATWRANTRQAAGLPA